ncbi:MAG: UbiD family decarboxylase [Dehalococcoidia bacterium]|nr:UbiD family decarboxylase [Dehalococcoidia bacterium]
MGYSDLRDWLDQVRAMGELKEFRGAHWDLELGTICDVVSRERKTKPAFLFDDVVGYPTGYRVLVNPLTSIGRVGLALGMPPDLTDMGFINEWRRRTKSMAPVSPILVSSGPILENVHTGEDIDLLEFPVPRYHELDGGRYLGTGSVTITQDPDTGWVNAGTYRVMVHDRKTLAFFVSPGKHGRIIREKYHAQGQPCPVAITFGQDPGVLAVCGYVDLPHGQSEFDFAGGITGKPIEIIRGPVTGLPIPASAEIAIEGFSYPGDDLVEGPFGEWTGYYASNARLEPCIRVKSIMHRNNPIISGAPPTRPSVSGHSLLSALLQSATIMDQMEAAGVPDVRSVRSHELAGFSYLLIVAIKQRYPGHARQAALVASQCRAGAYMGRYVIVVDEDIDPYNTDDVLWAMSTRSDPAGSIDIVRRCWSSPLDPAIPVGQKGFNSRAIIDACRPYEWMDKFPPVSDPSPELAKKVIEKWGPALL